LFIEACIHNVIDQVCSVAEHVIVDGGSYDGTVGVIRQYAENYPHIRWISEKDRGQSDAMNKGIAMAHGEIIGILNVDDYYELNVLNRVRGIFQNLSELSLVVGNCKVWDNSSKLKYINKPRNLKLEELLLGPDINPFPVNPSAYFYHKALHEIVGFYDVDEHYAQDLDFLLRSVRVARIIYVDEVWGNFRMCKGTKTMEDLKNNQAAARLEGILAKHWKYLSTSQRISVALRYVSHTNFFTGVQYYWKNPHRLFLLKAKLVRIFGLRL
jgi:glycosyltransferase involved in cell wall biosynthesis